MTTENKKCEWCGSLDNTPAYHYNCERAFKAGQSQILEKIKKQEIDLMATQRKHFSGSTPFIVLAGEIQQCQELIEQIEKELKADE